ncbi:hypothetical protein K3495_g1780 [Podosphaera aphanis]|nr:hypothetical protein K3495_g1780 [Podosphaera aphanis]
MRHMMNQVMPSTLLERLAKELPESTIFKIHYLCTPPTRSCSLYSAPPGEQPDKTYCENHFLAASINLSTTEELHERNEVLVFAIEVLVYTTILNTTFFVSKVDSSGYLNLLGLAKGTLSPIQTFSSTFLHYLINTHRRPNVQNVISLFARAQDQYLFPRSVEYKGKHVLDDRGLVRWWCRILNTILNDSMYESQKQWDSAKGYLIVPGMDPHECLSFIPDKSRDSWTISHPLLEISKLQGNVPPRCLVPHFPDDPKARFLDELDTEVIKDGKLDGQWKSIRSIDQFWEMMACRQECSAGRLVGFAWIVFTPIPQVEQSESINEHHTKTENLRQSGPSDNLLEGTSRLNINDFMRSELRTFRQSQERSKKNILTGPIIPRKPRAKLQLKGFGSNQLLKKLYARKSDDPCKVLVEELEYKRVIEFLLHLDFATVERATASTRRWIDEVSYAARRTMNEPHAQIVTGTKLKKTRAASSFVNVAMLDSGLVRKKRKKDSDPLL